MSSEITSRARFQQEVEITRWRLICTEMGRTEVMAERTKPMSSEHEETIAAFDREREEAHELGRRLRELVTNSRNNDRIIGRDHDNHDR